MSIKRSQKFLYFQSKTRHYANLQSARATVHTHSPPEPPSSSPRKLPYFTRYDIERANEKLILGITDIMNSSGLKKSERYSRRSQLLIQNEKSKKNIQYENEILANKMVSAKPSIGTMANWHAHSESVEQRKKSLGHSKNTLPVYSEDKFVPQHYRIFLNRSRDASQGTLEARQTICNMDKLFQLPKLQKSRRINPERALSELK